MVEYKPKKAHGSDDDEEEDRSPSSDDESVVHIDDPDPLAMMYMTIHGHLNSKRTQDQSSSAVSLKSLIYNNNPSFNSSSSSSSSSSVVVSNTGSRSLHRPTSYEVIDLQSDEDERTRVDTVIGYDSDCLIVEVDCAVASIAPDDNKTGGIDVMRNDPLLPLDAQGLPISLSEQRQKQLKGVAVNRSRFVPSLIKATHAIKPVVPTLIDSVAVPTTTIEHR